jgi:ribosomal protein S18 acetylase RimI-like enzyme
MTNTDTPKMGTYKAQDNSGNLILLEWERIEGQPARLNECVKTMSNILVNTYTQMELQFARKFPEAIPNEFFLKSLAPEFSQGIENIDWQQIESKIHDIFTNFFDVTDFAQFSAANEIHYFVVAKNADTSETLGLVQFLIHPTYANGTVKAGYYGVSSQTEDHGIGELLMSSIFKLLPMTNRIFLHTRKTNENAIHAYQEWGFKQFQESMPNWPDFEYLTEITAPLQKKAEQLLPLDSAVNA